jgi:formamidopyrimidine-DNA glycosylase
MIELPEATIIAGQISQHLKGKQIQSVTQGNSAHKFAFYSGTSGEYDNALKGRHILSAEPYGALILVSIEPDQVLVLGDGGERILYHKDETTIPKKHHLWLHFSDDTYLTVSIQAWGFVMLLPQSKVFEHPHIGARQVTPLEDGFNLPHFERLFDDLKEDDARSVKYFLISEPAVRGVRNGFLQDILWHAHIHPRRRAVDLSADEKVALYNSIQDVMQRAVDLGGRDTERDIFDQPGGYHKVLDSRSVGKPCPNCGTPIEKIQFLGGACYLCPNCQH